MSTVDHHAVILAFLSARQLESLVRLSEARAKLELREEVTRSDAEDVVDLLREVSGVSRQWEYVVLGAGLDERREEPQVQKHQEGMGWQDSRACTCSLCALTLLRSAPVLLPACALYNR